MTLRDWCLKSSFVHGSKERFFLATGGWNEHKNALDRRGRRGENTGTEKAEVRGGKMRLSERGGWGERWYWVRWSFFSMSKICNVDNFGLSVFRPWGNSGGEVTPAPHRYPPTQYPYFMYIIHNVSEGGNINVALHRGWKRYISHDRGNDVNWELEPTGVWYCDCINRRLDMELDLQSLFGLHVHAQLHSLATPATHPPSAFGLTYDGAIGQPR